MIAEIVLRLIGLVVVIGSVILLIAVIGGTTTDTPMQVELVKSGLGIGLGGWFLLDPAIG